MFLVGLKKATQVRLGSFLYNKVYRNKMLEEYDRIIQILGPAGASEAAARKMVALLKK